MLREHLEKDKQTGEAHGAFTQLPLQNRGTTWRDILQVSRTAGLQNMGLHGHTQGGLILTPQLYFKHSKISPEEPCQAVTQCLLPFAGKNTEAQRAQVLVPVGVIDGPRGRMVTHLPWHNLV